MNSEAASETQYEDLKSQLSTYRKADKIMLKRKFLSVLLALVLVVSMAVPAFAARTTDPENHPVYGGTCRFNMELDTDEVRGNATFDDPNYIIYMGVTAEAWCSAHTDYLYKYKEGESNMSVEVSVTNYNMNADGYHHDCNILRAIASLGVGTKNIFSGKSYNVFD